MASTTIAAPPALAKLAQHSEMVMALALFGMLGILIIPLPGSILDLLLALNLALDTAGAK